jgi:hypothetical protein
MAVKRRKIGEIAHSMVITALAFMGLVPKVVALE